MVGPNAGRGELDQMFVGIAEIKALPATVPFDSAFYRDAGFAEPFFPGTKVLRRYGEGKMQMAAPVMWRDHSAGHFHRFQSATAAKQNQDVVPANVEGAEAIVGCEAGKAEKTFVKSR